MQDEAYVGEKLWGYVESICGNGEGMEDDQVEALTREQVQAFINDIKLVCAKHGLALVGLCDDYMYGHIGFDFIENVKGQRDTEIKRDCLYLDNQWHVDSIIPEQDK